MKTDRSIHVEIQGVYDGWAFFYNDKDGSIEWRDFIIERTTPEFRKQQEESFRKNYLAEAGNYDEK